MAPKKKTDFLNIIISAVVASSAVLFVWLYKQPRFQSIPVYIISAAFFALLIESVVLTALKGRNPLKRAVKIFLVLLINFFVFTGAVIYSFAPAVILQPHTDEASYEALQSVAFAEEITFEYSDGEIYGWFYNIAGENAPTVLYFYGNYETAATRLLALTENYEASAFNGCNFAVFDYPSYGKSDGRCTDESILSFALAAYDNLSETTDNIIVLGYSLGTGPACYLAGKRDVHSLILYAPYADSTDLYNNVIDIFHGPLEKLVAFNIDSKESARAVTSPTLILASETDELIPFSSSEILSENFTGECTFMKTSAISHNQFLSDSFVREKTSEFIKAVTAE